MSTIKFRHELSTTVINKKGEKETMKENIIDGEKGLYISLLTKKGEDFYKIKIKELEGGKFEVVEKKGEKEDTKSVDMKEVEKMIKANDDLSFAAKYLKAGRKGGMTGGAVKKSKSSKKEVKKSKKSKKSTKKSRKY